MSVESASVKIQEVQVNCVNCVQPAKAHVKHTGNVCSATCLMTFLKLKQHSATGPVPPWYIMSIRFLTQKVKILKTVFIQQKENATINFKWYLSLEENRSISSDTQNV